LPRRQIPIVAVDARARARPEVSLPQTQGALPTRKERGS